MDKNDKMDKKIKIKKIAVVLSLLLIAVRLVSCTYGSYVTKKSVKRFTADSMYMRYESFSGYIYRKIRLSAGEKLLLDISANTDSGNLRIELLDENDAVLVSHDTEYATNKNYEYVPEDKGVYRIRVEGKHSGTFEIRWERE